MLSRMYKLHAYRYVTQPYYLAPYIFLVCWVIHTCVACLCHAWTSWLGESSYNCKSCI